MSNKVVIREATSPTPGGFQELSSCMIRDVYDLNCGPAIPKYVREAEVAIAAVGMVADRLLIKEEEVLTKYEVHVRHAHSGIGQVLYRPL